MPDPADLARSALLSIAALLPIVNPMGVAPIFLSMSADLPAAARHQLSRKVAWNAFILLAAAMLVGSYVLKLFGISLPIVRVGGGLLVTVSGWQLLNDGDTRAERRTPPVAETWEREVARRAFFPLTFPLTVGPGSISIAITLGAQIGGRGAAPGILEGAMNLIGVAVVAVMVFLSYRFASRLISYLGETGTTVFLRLSAFILLCVGVGILWSGIVDLVEPLLRRS